MIRFFLLVAFFLFLNPAFGQLGFCEGSKGDPIFQEDFGSATGYGVPLATGITNYNFVSQDPEDGEYTISTIVGREIGSWHSSFPNTTVSNGQALIVNAGFTSGRFYRKEISGLCENTTYEFSAFLMNVFNPSSNGCPTGEIPVNVRFEIWDETDTELLKAGSTGAIYGTASPEWEQFALTFKSETAQNNVILKMFNNGDGGCGNDLAIDDIIFRSCGDLTTISSNGEQNIGMVVCEEDAPISIVLEATPDNSVYQTHAYQWQESGNGENWVDIAGANQDRLEVATSANFKYFRVRVAEDILNLNNNLCSSVSKSFYVNILEKPVMPLSQGDKLVCGEEQIPVLMVSTSENTLVNWYDAEFDGNLLKENSVSFQPSEEGVFYAEALNVGMDCAASNRVAIKIEIISVPDLEDEELQLCPDSSVTLDAGVEGYAYRWSTGEISQVISITQPGTFQVEVITSGDCSSIKRFLVKPVDKAEIAKVESDEDNVIIIAANPGKFEYSLDGINFQDSNTFPEVPSGVYTAYMRDVGVCNTVSVEFPHIIVSKMITPNGDGYNDFFTLNGLELFPSSEIMIFDRYGKLLKYGNGINFSWNGTFNGTNLPASDYWYHIIIEGYEILKGHFTLLR